jgi:hypothetical protein
VVLSVGISRSVAKRSITNCRVLFSILNLYLHVLFNHLGQWKSFINIPTIRRIKSIRDATRGVCINKTIPVISAATAIGFFRFVNHPYYDHEYSNREQIPVVHLQFVNIFLCEDSKMNKAILIREKLGDIVEIDLDIDPFKNEIFQILEGRQTFIGQWPDIDVVIMKPESGKVKNENTLPYPFDGEDVYGKILLVRMDENSEPQDFTLREYRRYKRLPV